MNKIILGVGGIIAGLLVALTTVFQWSDNLNYLWALLVIVLGILAFLKN